MTVADLAKALRERWIVVVSLAIAGIVVATLVSLLLPTRYTAQARIYVSAQTAQDGTSAYQGSLLSEQRVRSYQSLASSYRVVSNAATSLRSSVNTADLTRMISTNVEADTAVLDVSVEGATYDSAVANTNAVSQSLLGLIGELERPADNRSSPAVVARVVDNAVGEPNPVSPRWKLNLLAGALVGLIVGAGIAVFLKSRDTGIKDSAVLARATGRPSLGKLGATNLLSRDTGSDRGSFDIGFGDRSEPAAEDYRLLRNSLRYLAVDGELKSIAVVSALSGEGKSTVACGLASVLASGGASVVLVDADLRKPSIDEYLSLVQGPGLTDVLAGRIAVREVLGRVGRFSVIQAGSKAPNPADLTASNQMSSLLASLRRDFDYVIVDTPPLSVVSDAGPLAAHVDGSLLVCKYQATKYEAVTTAIDRLSATGAELLGAVLNHCPGGSASAYGNYGTGPRPTSFDLPPSNGLSDLDSASRRPRPFPSSR